MNYKAENSILHDKKKKNHNKEDCKIINPRKRGLKRKSIHSDIEAVNWFPENVNRLLVTLKKYNLRLQLNS